MSRFPSDGKNKSTNESNYVLEKLLEIYDVEEIKMGTFPLKFTAIYHYQREDPVIQAKLISAK